MFSKNEHLPFWQTPWFWDAGVGVFVGILPWMFW
jgi:hypothetical protein